MAHSSPMWAKSSKTSDHTNMTTIRSFSAATVVDGSRWPWLTPPAASRKTDITGDILVYILNRSRVPNGTARIRALRALLLPTTLWRVSDARATYLAKKDPMRCAGRGPYISDLLHCITAKIKTLLELNFLTLCLSSLRISVSRESGLKLFQKEGRMNKGKTEEN